ncbi:receptor-like protein EIX2 [Curcuma longa]|uniref:receptor-like protein EIX2 n=1 Tax=Curcuma longa TaxID=136217 RepID=UPI003D9F6B89
MFMSKSGNMKASLLLLMLLFILGCLTTTASSCLAVERDALFAFRAGMNGMRQSTPSWEEEEDCCKWEGVVCHPTTRHVVKLKLSERIQQDHRGQVHEINSSLLALTELKHLDLSYNYFYNVPFPKFIGYFKKLKYLNLSSSFFTGSIPLAFRNLTKLRYLDLDGALDYEQQHIDNLDWLTNLSSLKHLDISGLRLTNLAEWILPSSVQGSLNALIMRDCNLSAFPVSSSNVNFTSLEILDIYGNNFNSRFPQWVCNVSSLEHLNLGFSGFYGTIPEAIGGLTSLTYLDLSNNFNVEGTIPRTITHLQRLELLSLQGNRLSGSLASWIVHLTSLTLADLCDNTLNGSIPTGIGKLSNLTSLYLCGNKLQGSVSEVHLANLTRLEDLDLSYNNLKVSFDPNWVAPFQLATVQLMRCGIGPQIPRWLQLQTRIETLDLSDNQIAGTLPSWLWNLSSSTLQFLYLSSNQIKGKLPTFSEVSRLQELRLDSNGLEGQLDDFFSYNYSSTQVESPTQSDVVLLSLANNILEGGIPLSICNWTRLVFLHFSNNSLTGEIPYCLGESLQELMTLNLACNHLFGEIPTTIGFMRQLSRLALNNNGFSGQLPSSLQNCTNLFYLDLAYNAFAGSLPAWMGESLQRLQVLHLGFNNFSGNIPEQLTQLEELEILNLSNNSFSGSLPFGMGNFTAMASTSQSWYQPTVFLNKRGHYVHGTPYSHYVDLVISTKGQNLHYPYDSELTKSLDFSGNSLIGEIPPGIGRLKGLQNLNLARNHLSGSIPEEIGEMESLESLDLSVNELSGNIPNSLANLNFLAYLNLSYNNLVGKIPSGHQLQTLNDTSRYMGNPGLCGPPLSNDCSVAESVHEVHKMKDFEWIWLFIPMIVGFVMGFWTFCGLLFFKTEWRYAYFRGIDSCYDRILLQLHLCLARLSRQD